MSARFALTSDRPGRTSRLVLSRTKTPLAVGDAPRDGERPAACPRRGFPSLFGHAAFHSLRGIA